MAKIASTVKAVNSHLYVSCSADDLCQWGTQKYIFCKFVVQAMIKRSTYEYGVGFSLTQVVMGSYKSYKYMFISVKITHSHVKARVTC